MKKNNSKKKKQNVELKPFRGRSRLGNRKSAHVEIIKPGVLRLLPSEFLDKYAESPQLRKCFDTGKYVYAEGYIALKTPECIELYDGNIRIKKEAQKRLEDYCIYGGFAGSRSSDISDEGEDFAGDKNDNRTICWSRSHFCKDYKRPLSNIKMVKHSVGFGPPRSVIEILDAKKFSEVETNDWEQVLKVYNIPDDFDEALVFLMNERNMTVEQLAEKTGLSEKTITRLRNGNNTPSLASVVAICIGLYLNSAMCDKLINVAGFYLGGKTRDVLYKTILGVAYAISVSQANEFLNKFGLPGLTKN